MALFHVIQTQVILLFSLPPFHFFSWLVATLVSVQSLNRLMLGKLLEIYHRVG